MQNIQVIKISLHQAERFFYSVENTVGIGCNEKNVTSIVYLYCCFKLKGKRSGQLTDFQYPAVFPFEFSVLPRKISEYLRADFPSDVNSRKIRVLFKILNIKDLQ